MTDSLKIAWLAENGSRVEEGDALRHCGGHQPLACSERCLEPRLVLDQPELVGVVAECPIGQPEQLGRPLLLAATALQGLAHQAPSDGVQMLLQIEALLGQAHLLDGIVAR